MKLLKAYVHQVVSYHPPADRDELFAEIYDAVCEEYTDQLVQHPALSEAEFLNTSKQHPMKYATQLAAGGSSYLVGPQFYFSFLSTLKTGASITAGIFLVLAVVSALASENHWRTFFQVLFELPEALLWVGAMILGVFVAMEKGGEKANWLEGWKASDLKMADGHQSISRGESFFDLSFSTIALLWIFDVIPVPSVINHNDVWIKEWVILLPDWCWVAAVALLIFDIGFSLFRMTRNLWTSRLRLTTVVTNALWLALLGFIISQSPLLDVASSSTKTITDLMPLLNKVLKGGLMVVLLIITWDTLNHIRHLLKQEN